ncbi:hypothetical protein ABIB53_000946 [Janibacter sp. UYMM211]
MAGAAVDLQHDLVKCVHGRLEMSTTFGGGFPCGDTVVADPAPVSTVNAGCVTGQIAGVPGSVGVMRKSERRLTALAIAQICAQQVLRPDARSARSRSCALTPDLRAAGLAPWRVAASRRAHVSRLNRPRRLDNVLPVSEPTGLCVLMTFGLWISVLPLLVVAAACVSLLVAKPR